MKKRIDRQSSPLISVEHKGLDNGTGVAAPTSVDGKQSTSANDGSASLDQYSFENVLRKLSILNFQGLDPQHGTGYVSLDLRAALPRFLLHELPKFKFPENGVWAFDGDPSVEHYIDFAQSSTELSSIVGDQHVEQLKVFSAAVLRGFTENLPVEEQRRLHEKRKRLVLDLAELRISDGTKTIGSNVHIDWYPREGMVLIIPLAGSRTKIFAPHSPMVGLCPGEGVLITAFERWANFHSFDATAIGNNVQVNVGKENRVVPRGMLGYLKSRGRLVSDDMQPHWPGVLPTVHQAGKGARTNLVLNFAYQAIT
jgi:hypothetical protein